MRMGIPEDTDIASSDLMCAGWKLRGRMASWSILSSCVLEDENNNQKSEEEEEAEEEAEEERKKSSLVIVTSF